MQKNMNIDVDTEALIESVRPEMAISLPKTLPEQEQPHPSPQKDGRQKVRSPSQKEVKPALIDEYQQLFPDYSFGQVQLVLVVHVSPHSVAAITILLVRLNYTL